MDYLFFIYFYFLFVVLITVKLKDDFIMCVLQCQAVRTSRAQHSHLQSSVHVIKLQSTIEHQGSYLVLQNRLHRLAFHGKSRNIFFYLMLVFRGRGSWVAGKKLFLDPDRFTKQWQSIACSWSCTYILVILNLHFGSRLNRSWRNPRLPKMPHLPRN